MGNENKIDWDSMLSGNFIKLENGKPKKLMLTNWRHQDKFKDDDGLLKPGLIFDATEEDGVKLEKNKTWTVTAIKALAKLKPLIQAAEAAGQTKIAIVVIRVGEGRNTQYDIKQQ